MLIVVLLIILQIRLGFTLAIFLRTNGKVRISLVMLWEVTANVLACTVLLLMIIMRDWVLGELRRVIAANLKKTVRVNLHDGWLEYLLYWCHCLRVLCIEDREVVMI